MTDDELRELAETAHQLEQLAAHPAWPVLQQLASVELDKTRRAVLSGQLDQEKYHRYAGFLAGGEMVANIPGHVASLYADALTQLEADEQARAEEDEDLERAA